MKLCILELDRPSDDQILSYGDYGDMFTAWLAPALPKAQFTKIAVDLTHQLPSLSEYDGYVLTGCRHGVYDDIPWKSALKQFLLDARDAGIPLAGVCFGHQIMAATFGADVHKSKHGWVLGKQIYANQAAIAIHQDQVLSYPIDTESVTGSDECPIGRIVYSFPAISTQYHPEFPMPYIREFLSELRDNPVPAARVDAAEDDLKAKLNCAEIADDFANVFRQILTQSA